MKTLKLSEINIPLFILSVATITLSAYMILYFISLQSFTPLAPFEYTLRLSFWYILFTVVLFRTFMLKKAIAVNVVFLSLFLCFFLLA